LGYDLSRPFRSDGLYGNYNSGFAIDEPDADSSEAALMEQIQLQSSLGAGEFTLRRRHAFNLVTLPFMVY
jgi:hypothetical protein